MGPENWKFLQDEPSAQVIICEGDRLPSFLPNGRMAWCSAKDEYKVAEATILRKAECIVIRWCSTFMFKLLWEAHIPSTTVRLCAYRGGELVEESKIRLHDSYFYYYEFLGIREIRYWVTLRRKHRVVEAVQPGDRLLAFLECDTVFPLAISTSEANVCVVYNGDGHLLLEVNSELLSENGSRELETQFGELVLKDENQGEN